MTQDEASYSLCASPTSQLCSGFWLWCLYCCRQSQIKEWISLEIVFTHHCQVFLQIISSIICVFLLPSLLQLLCTDLPEKSPRRQIQWEMPVVFYGISDWNGWWDDCLDHLENCRIRSSVPQKRQEIDC